MSHAIGVDVSKATLESCAAPGEPSRTHANTPEGIAEWMAWAKQRHPSRFVVEASGGYEQRLLRAATSAGLVGCLVNALQVRHFAKALGQRAKSDPVDAAVLQRFGDIMEPPAYVPPAPEQEALQALLRVGFAGISKCNRLHAGSYVGCRLA